MKWIFMIETFIKFVSLKWLQAKLILNHHGSISMASLFLLSVVRTLSLIVLIRQNQFWPVCDKQPLHAGLAGWCQKDQDSYVATFLSLSVFWEKKLLRSCQRELNKSDVEFECHLAAIHRVYKSKYDSMFCFLEIYIFSSLSWWWYSLQKGSLYMPSEFAETSLPYCCFSSKKKTASSCQVD